MLPWGPLIHVSLLTGMLQEYEDVQLTAFLSSLTKSTNILNDVRCSYYATPGPSTYASSIQLVDKHLVLTASREDRGTRRRMGGRQGGMPDWGDRMHG